MATPLRVRREAQKNGCRQTDMISGKKIKNKFIGEKNHDTFHICFCMTNQVFICMLCKINGNSHFRGNVP